MATMSISLPDSLKIWAQEKAENGDYSTPSDYIRSLIRDDKARSLQKLEAMLLEGLESGNPVLDTPESRAAFRNKAQEIFARQKGSKPATK